MAITTFMVELQRRLRSAGSQVLSVGAHPGGVRSTILRDQSVLVRIAYSDTVMTLARLVTQTPEQGALPILRAALDPGVTGGAFYGPAKRWGLVGPAVPVAASPLAHDPDNGRRLWALAEQLTGVVFPFGENTPPSHADIPVHPLPPAPEAAGESA